MHRRAESNRFPPWALLTPRCGTRVAISAWRLTGWRAEVIPELRLIAFGNMAFASELPFPEDARYYACAPNQALRGFYSQCDAWLFGTRQEGFGLPILEAMACRTPVIGTPAGAAPQLLQDGAGVLVNPEDPKDMARAILDVCRLSDSDWRKMSTIAHAKASVRTWDEGTRAFDRALRELLQNKVPENNKQFMHL